MADGRHIAECWKRYNLLINEPIGMKLGSSQPSMSPTYPPWCSCHGNGALNILHGRLETERVNQFWWNLVSSTKFGPQWQSRDQILKFLKFKIADGRHVRKYLKCHNSPTNRPTATQLGWSYPIMPPTCPPWCGCHGDGRCLATAHWTFCSYGRLEGERVNQFWWNLVYNSKSGPQWQSRDQIIFKIQNGGRPPCSKIFKMP